MTQSVIRKDLQYLYEVLDPVIAPVRPGPWLVWEISLQLPLVCWHDGPCLRPIETLRCLRCRYMLHRCMIGVCDRGTMEQERY